MQPCLFCSVEASRPVQGHMCNVKGYRASVQVPTEYGCPTRDYVYKETSTYIESVRSKGVLCGVKPIESACLVARMAIIPFS